MRNRRKIAILLTIEFIIIFLLVAVDLLTKKFIYEPIKKGAPDIVVIKGVLRFVAVENTGASFGIFSGKTHILAILSLIILVFAFIVLVLTINKINNKLFRSSLVLIIAGGIGNVIDRFLLKYVRDFIYFELIDFAVFNFADSCLTIGCLLLIIFVILYYIVETKKEKSNRVKEVNQTNINTDDNNLVEEKIEINKKNNKPSSCLDTKHNKDLSEEQSETDIKED